MDHEMLDQQSKSEKSSKDRESDYNESEDEDYIPEEDVLVARNKEGLKITDDEDTSADEEEQEKELMKKYAVIESGSGGLIKTRSQRVKEAEAENIQKVINEKPSVDVNLIWQLMNLSQKATEEGANMGETSDVHSDTQNNDEDESDTIVIKRSYEYAGETILEDKVVPRYSAEAKAYLSSLKLKEDQKNKQVVNNKIKIPSTKVSKPTAEILNTNKPKILIRRRKKKVSIVDSILKGKGLVKINTLEKSRLDWANYVDKNQLNDELKKHNKDGYLSKMDFLNKVEHNVYNKTK